MAPTQDLVRFGLTNPESLTSLSLADWDLVVQQGRKAAMLGRIHALLDESDLLQLVPIAPRAHLQAADIVALSQERVVRWEVSCIKRTLANVQPDFVLLKGAAYVLSKLPFARGRLQSDIDILVPKNTLNAVESAFLANGWKNIKLEKYDQRYYRQWTHELPPLYHPKRGTIIDIHHNILPEKGRLHPDPNRLLERAEPIPGTPYKRLCPADMVLHTAAHMFQDGDLHQSLRELADIDGLLRVFHVQPGFWEALIRRAPEMDLRRPLFYALRYSQLFLETPIPEFVMSASQEWKPPKAVIRIMDLLVVQALRPQHATTATIVSPFARWLLYVRSHWLRMPPLLLTQHLIHKAFKR
jgi:hypothetical protein